MKIIKDGVSGRVFKCYECKSKFLAEKDDLCAHQISGALGLRCPVCNSIVYL